MPSFPVTLTSLVHVPTCWPLSSLTNISPIILSTLSFQPSTPTVQTETCLYKLHHLWNIQFILNLWPAPFLTAHVSNNLTAKILINRFSPINLPQHFLTITSFLLKLGAPGLSLLLFLAISLTFFSLLSFFFFLVKPQSVMIQPSNHEFCAYIQKEECCSKKEMWPGRLVSF